MVHAHYSELDAIYAFNSQPSQCLYYVIIRIIGAGVSLFKISSPTLSNILNRLTPAPIIRITFFKSFI